MTKAKASKHQWKKTGLNLWECKNCGCEKEEVMRFYGIVEWQYYTASARMSTYEMPKCEK